jgi:hypothetical protein
MRGVHVVCVGFVDAKTRDPSGHLCKYGYMPNYEVWVYHGEEFPRENMSEAHNNDDVEYNRMDKMLQDLRDDPEFCVSTTS